MVMQATNRAVGNMVKLCCIILPLLLTSCASSLDLSDAKKLPQGQSIVIGRISVISDGKPRTWHWYLQGFRVLVLSDATSEAVGYPLTGDGSFYWHLPPGGYTIVGFKWGAEAQFSTGRIFAEFKVPQEQAIIYIGTLVIPFAGPYYTPRIENHYDQAVQTFESKFPELKGTVVTDLMQLEKPR